MFRLLLELVPFDSIQRSGTVELSMTSENYSDFHNSNSGPKSFRRAFQSSEDVK